MRRIRISPYASREAIARARELRRAMTPAERALKAGLRASLAGAHFRYQAPFGGFYPDFVCHAARLIIEVDGSQHHDAAGYDAARTRFLRGHGYRVLRFWNNEVLTNLDGVLTAIASHLPSPLVGEGAPKGRMGGARRSRAPTSARSAPPPSAGPIAPRAI